MRCKNCGRRTASTLCRQCRMGSMESEALEHDYNEWGRETEEIKQARKKALKGAEVMKNKWRKRN